MKKFIIKSLFYIVPFFCFYGVYRIVDKNTTGDIGRLGKIFFEEEYVQYLEKNYLTDNLTIDTLITSYEKLQIDDASDVCTIGDSFSSLGMFGYQNYLAHLLGFKIINILKIDDNQLNTAIALINSKIIDNSNCRIFILSNVDRLTINRLTDIDFEMLYKKPLKIDDNQDSKNTKISLNDLFSFIRLKFGYDNPILKHSLKQECFTHDRFSKTLFNYKGDMNFLKTSKIDIAKAKENLILLNKKFSEKGIKLIFLIAADKYDVYRPFMVGNSLPIDTTTDELSNIPDVFVINTKPMLQEMVQKGEKDVYMINDTHWSYKASEAVARELAHAIDSLGF
ncbi:MAG: hypothetical protein LBC64_02080 [Fibromonadaceae bacterium]|jgi:hypothetical protein|nr:hypothetical protein [Fibromonadaceae bacterium]